MVIFTENELADMAKSPHVLRELADIHECLATADEAGGWTSSMVYHDKRRDELRAEAKRLEDEA
jgi:hypothetical protein